MLFLLNEHLYSVEQVTGTSNAFVIMILLIVGFLYQLVNSQKVRLDFIYIPTFIVLVFYVYIAGGRNHLAIFYAVEILFIFVFKDVSISTAKFLFSMTIIMGLMYTIFQYLTNVDSRVTGFLLSSPTIFSYLVLIATVYFIFQEKNILSYLLIFLGLGQIYLTSSRSTLLLGIVFFIYKKVLQPFFQVQRTKSSKIIVIFSVLLALVLIYFLKDTVIIRENGHESTETRRIMIVYFIKYILVNPSTLLFGAGAGFTNEAIPAILSMRNVTSYPLHQDLLTVLVEFGTIGCLFLSIFMLYKKKLNWLVVSLFLVGTFHNIILSPISIAMLIILDNSLVEEKSYIES